MFVYEAADLLKNVLCPFCKKDVCPLLGSPFARFDAHALCQDCTTRDCAPFYDEVNAQVQSFEAGKITTQDFRQWLDTLKAPGAAL